MQNKAEGTPSALYIGLLGHKNIGFATHQLGGASQLTGGSHQLAHGFVGLAVAVRKI